MGTEVRSLFIARPGMKLICADYAQLELRLLAHYSGDEVMLNAFRTGLDLHTLTAANTNSIPYDELVARLEASDADAKKMRSVAKSQNFGLSYGMQAKKFQVYLLVNNELYYPLETVQSFIDGFNQSYPQLYQWKSVIHQQVRRDGYVTTIGGRKRRLPGIYSHDRYEVMEAERQAVNVFAQGGGADIVADAMIKIQARLKPLGGSILIQVHDEILTEVPEAHAEEGKQIIETAMTEINKHLICPLAAEAKIGSSWYDAK